MTPNGSVIEKASINDAFTHATQPDPHLVNLRAGMILIVTTDQQLTQDIVIPAGVELRVTNNAVITIPSGRNLSFDPASEFQKPHYNCFFVAVGGVLGALPEAGPVTQNWSIKNLIASGTATIAGALTGLSAIFTGNVTAGSFTGPLTGNVTGNAATATEPNPAGHIVKSADVNQRTIRGSVAADGTGSGTGWTAVGAGAGISNITFNPAFAAIPTVVACIKDTTSSQAVISASTITASTCQIRRYSAVIGNLDAYQFNFIAIGTSL